MATSASLSEPHVLAHTKRRLFPDSEGDTETTYAVCDTQFATEEWVPGEPIPPAIRDRLAPFNHVRVGSGYPDLVGAGRPDRTFLATERLGDRPPLVAVEAKGYTESGDVDVERGIVQAHDRLSGANLAYAAAPAEAISSTARTLARECNVGLLGVAVDGTVESLEAPRVVGHRTDDDAGAIRFQASAQGVTDDSFGLNHPKNYLGYALAVVHPDETANVVETRVVGAVDEARRGAAALGLIESKPHRIDLTPLGEEVVRFALSRHGSIASALSTVERWQRSRTRFCDLEPAWGQLTRRVVWRYPAASLLVEELQTMYDDGIAEPTLVDVVEWIHVHHPTFAVELFVRSTGAARERVLDESGGLMAEALTDGSVYHSPTVFQLKTMLYHAGILEERGSEPHRLEPATDRWTLREPVSIGGS